MRRTTPSKSGSPTGQINSTPPTRNTGASVAGALALPSNPWRFCRKAGTTVTQTPAPPQLSGGVGHKQGSVQRHWFGGYSWATVAAHKARSCDEKTLALLSQELSLPPATPGASVANAGTTVAKHPLVPAHRRRVVPSEAACNATGPAVIAWQPWQHTRQDPVMRKRLAHLSQEPPRSPTILALLSQC